MKCELALRRNLFKSIFVTGGNSLLPGLERRLKRELQQLVTHFEVSFLTSTEKKYTTWRGSSMIGALDAFNTMMKSKHVYDEYGPGKFVRDIPW